PELIDAVSTGKIKVRVAAELARYSREKQVEILAKGPGSIRAAATFWKRQEKENSGNAKPRRKPTESFLIGCNRGCSEDQHYRMQVDHEYRDELTSMLDESHDEQLEKALRRGLLIVMKQP